MRVRLRGDGCVMAGASCVVTLALALLDRAPAAAQVSAERVLERVSRYVEDYFTRAQSLMVEETVTVQETSGDLMPQGFARTLVYDLRFEWRLDGDSGEPRVNV